MSSSGAGPTRLTTNTVEDGSPSWSPDGTKIVFSRCCAGAAHAGSIYTMTSGGASVTALTSAAVDAQPDWGPPPPAPVPAARSSAPMSQRRGQRRVSRVDDDRQRFGVVTALHGRGSPGHVRRGAERCDLLRRCRRPAVDVQGPGRRSHEDNRSRPACPRLRQRRDDPQDVRHPVPGELVRPRCERHQDPIEELRDLPDGSVGPRVGKQRRRRSVRRSSPRAATTAAYSTYSAPHPPGRDSRPRFPSTRQPAASGQRATTWRPRRSWPASCAAR